MINYVKEIEKLERGLKKLEEKKIKLQKQIQHLKELKKEA